MKASHSTCFSRFAGVFQIAKAMAMIALGVCLRSSSLIQSGPAKRDTTASAQCPSSCKRTISLRRRSTLYKLVRFTGCEATKGLG